MIHIIHLIQTMNYIEKFRSLASVKKVAKITLAFYIHRLVTLNGL